MPHCDVCGDEAIGVACSRLGPISLAYCKRCAEECAEPYAMVVSMVAVNGGSLDYFHEGFHYVVESSLRVAEKTMDEFMADVAKETKAIEEDLATEKERDDLTTE